MAMTARQSASRCPGAGHDGPRVRFRNKTLRECNSQFGKFLRICEKELDVVNTMRAFEVAKCYEEGVQRLDRKLVVFERPTGKDDPRRVRSGSSLNRERLPQLAKLLVAGSHSASRHPARASAVLSSCVPREVARMPTQHVFGQPLSNA